MQKLEDFIQTTKKTCSYKHFISNKIMPLVLTVNHLEYPAMTSGQMHLPAHLSVCVLITALYILPPDNIHFLKNV